MEGFGTVLMESYHTGVTFSQLLAERLQPVKDMMYRKYKEEHVNDPKTVGDSVQWLWKHDIITIALRSAGENRTMEGTKKTLREHLEDKKRFHDAKEKCNGWTPFVYTVGIHKFINDILDVWERLEDQQIAHCAVPIEERINRQNEAQKTILSYSLDGIEKMCGEVLDGGGSFENIDALLSDATNTTGNKWTWSKFLDNETVAKLYAEALIELREWLPDNMVEDAGEDHSRNPFYVDAWNTSAHHKENYLCEMYMCDIERTVLPKVLERRGSLWDGIDGVYHDVPVYDYGSVWISEFEYGDGKKCFVIQVTGCDKSRVYNARKKNEALIYTKALFSSGVELLIDENKPKAYGEMFTEEFGDLCRSLKLFVPTYPRVDGYWKVPRYYYDRMLKKRWWLRDLAGWERVDIDNDSIETLARRFAGVFDKAASPRHEKLSFDVAVEMLLSKNRYTDVLLYYINKGVRVGKKSLFRDCPRVFDKLPVTVDYRKMGAAKPTTATLEGHLHKHVLRNYVTSSDGKVVLEGVFYDVENKQIKASDGKQAVFLNEPGLDGESKVVRVGNCHNGPKGTDPAREGCQSYPDISVLLNRERDCMGYLDVDAFYRMVSVWNLVLYYFPDHKIVDEHYLSVSFDMWSEPITKHFPFDKIKYAVDLLLFRNQKSDDCITVHVDSESYASQRVVLLLLENAVGDRVIMAPISTKGGDGGNGLRYDMPLVDDKPKTKTRKKGLLDLIGK